MDTLTPDRYFKVALEVLADSGPSAVTVGELCTRLGVTKGSFYHHFDGRPQFVEGLLNFWANEHSAQLIEVSHSVPDSRERIAVLKGIAVDLPHDAEAAIRAWSSQDETVAAAQSRVDRLRLDHLREAYVAAGVPADRASVLATIAMSVLAGMQMLVRPTDPRLVRHMFDELESAFFGQPEL